MKQPLLVDLLSPETLSRIENYSLLARVAVDGFISGMHRSLSQGLGGEFLQYRHYNPGDDLKYVDWKVFSRQNKFYTKVFREETDMNCCLVLDASASMSYQGSRSPCSKWHYARMVAACLAYMASRQGDNVGLYLYNDNLLEGISPGRKHGQLHRVLSTLKRHSPSGPANHEEVWKYLTGHLRHRGIVVFLSDFLEADETLPPLLKTLRSARHECVAIQVLDPDEIDFPFNQSMEFIDAEGKGRVSTFPENVRRDYVKRMNDFLERLSLSFTQSRVDHLRLQTSDSLANSLATYLHKRDSLR